MLTFVNSVRSGDFLQYKRAIKDFLPWLFAMYHVNYSRWLSIHLYDMPQLPESNPHVFESFMEGKFVITKTKKALSSVGIDHVHEQNNKCVKGDGGLYLHRNVIFHISTTPFYFEVQCHQGLKKRSQQIHKIEAILDSGLTYLLLKTINFKYLFFLGVIGLTVDSNQMLKWMVSGPEISRIINEFQRYLPFNIDKQGANDRNHHEQTRSAQERFVKHVKSLCTAFEEAANPFLEESKDLKHR